MADLMERIEQSAMHFNFFALLGLLEEYFAERGNHNPLDNGAIRLAPDSGLAFPSSDIRKAHSTHDSLTIFSTFMGLCGSVSPLPIYFSEYCARHANNDDSLYDFLMMFNHRFYVLFYRAWKKYRLVNNLLTKNSTFLKRFSALAGLPQQQKENMQESSLLACCGIMATKTRGEAGLCSLLSYMFNDIPISLQQFFPRYAEINDVAPLGMGKLGSTTLLGTRIADCTGKFRIVVGPLVRSVFETFLPGSDNIRRMKSIVSAYLVDPLDFDIKVTLQALQLVPVILGDTSSPLGFSSSLGNSLAATEIQTIVIENN